MTDRPAIRQSLCALLLAGTVALSFAAPATAQVTAFRQTVAEQASRDDGIAAFYRARDFAPIWTGDTDADRARRMALIEALGTAAVHGLPVPRYDAAGLMRKMGDARTARERGAIEVELSQVFVRFARDLQTGVLEPRKVDAGLVREVPLRDTQANLVALTQGDPRVFFRALAPRTQEYARLMKEKLLLERVLPQGGWGPAVNAAKLEPGQSGTAVVALRNRMIAMGYMTRSAAASYDSTMQMAVQQFQTDHGLETDGVAGSATLKEINRSVEERLQSIVVAMERERWINFPEGLGKRHINVNLTDFTARIIDDNKVTFETRAVVGADSSDRRTPEFSDVMEFMVINPSWYVPRSIVVKEYLPLLRRNPGAVSHLEITDSRGRRVARNGFSQYSASSFPFAMRQPPGPRNALGQVKFMFPNKYNIYLHDTPSKSLFAHDVRAYSHGCVRLGDPFDFAYALLAKQTDDPKGLFQSRLRSKAESRVNLDEPVRVHIMYRTAFTTAKGKVNYRADVYGRDGRIWDALSNAGVALTAQRG
nr:L,D-transpeptidase family protein [Puniceibacterium sp. IMCC21224]